MKMKRAFLSLACAMVAWAQAPAHTPHYPNDSNGLVMYGAMHQSDSSLWPTINNWLGARFDWILGGPNQYVGYQNTGDPHGANPTKLYWSAYHHGGYVPSFQRGHELRGQHLDFQDRAIRLPGALLPEHRVLGARGCIHIQWEYLH
jgi:hypothetical protein